MLQYGLLLLLATVAADATTTVNETAESCPSPFVLVGSRCVHLDLTVIGTWDEMRQFCQEMGSDLAVLSDAQFYVDSQQYIRTIGMLGTDATAMVNETAESCSSPFVLVGSRCVHLDLTVIGSWEEMRQFCQGMGSDLAVLSDAQFYVDSQQYIRTLGTPAADVSFWIGATDAQEEGLWLWIDGTPVVMGTPYWGYWGTNGCSDYQVPNGGTSENCARLGHDYYHYLNDFSCSSSGYPFCVI